MPILNWLTRDKDIRAAARVPYRLLEEIPQLSAGEPGADNILMHGDNLQALKSLLPFYAGRVKCIYIDPPYNTGSTFGHYDDNLEHTQWLGIMWPRLELLRELLSEDGSIWVSIDDNEGHYLKVIMDEVFGRKNLISNVVWQKIYTVKNSRQVSFCHARPYPRLRPIKRPVASQSLDSLRQGHCQLFQPGQRRTRSLDDERRPGAKLLQFGYLRNYLPLRSSPCPAHWNVLENIQRNFRRIGRRQSDLVGTGR